MKLHGINGRKLRPAQNELQSNIGRFCKELSRAAQVPNQVSTSHIRRKKSLRYLLSTATSERFKGGRNGKSLGTLAEDHNYDDGSSTRAILRSYCVGVGRQASHRGLKPLPFFFSLGLNTRQFAGFNLFGSITYHPEYPCSVRTSWRMSRFFNVSINSPCFSSELP
jgi:hypothetical protein